MDKSYVSLGYSQCPICGVKHSEVILLDKRLRNSLNKETCVEHALCPEHQKLHEDGYIALVVADEKTKMRTGDLVHVKNHVFTSLFNIDPKHSFYYMEPAVFEQLKGIVNHE